MAGLTSECYQDVLQAVLSSGESAKSGSFCPSLRVPSPNNQSLEMFKEAWNHHGLHTMHNASPHQLYTAGTLRLQHSNIQALDFFEDVDNAYGIDENVTWAPNAETTVNVPVTRVNVASETYALLQAQIDPLAESDNFGIESVVRLLQAILQ